jgi:hypothetical protein
MKTYNFPDHYRGTTFDGATFTVSVNSLPLDLTDAEIKMQLRNSETATGAFALELSTENESISITTPEAGVFSILPKVINISATTYFYDIQITLPSGAVKTYIKGQWKILQNITA